jgi:uncharacterized protein
MKDYETMSFKPAWWLRNKHLQTIWPTFLKRSLKVSVMEERLELPDGDFIDLVFAGNSEEKPLVIILHGLGGSLQSPYATGLINTLVEKNWSAVFMYFRGASHEPNRLPQSYHSGATQDFDFLVKALKKRYQNRPLYAVGFSLGGNVLLKWLGEEKKNVLIERAIAVSVPYDLASAANTLQQGVSQYYQSYLLNKLKAKYQEKCNIMKLPIPQHAVMRCENFWEFDDLVTAPLHGFANVQDYYEKCSSRQFLKHIEIPTLLIHALDDPFMTPDVIPREDEVSSQVRFNITPQGGHVGFITGMLPGVPEYWLDKQVIDFFQAPV